MHRSRPRVANNLNNDNQIPVGPADNDISVDVPINNEENSEQQSQEISHISPGIVVGTKNNNNVTENLLNVRPFQCTISGLPAAVPSRAGPSRAGAGPSRSGPSRPGKRKVRDSIEILQEVTKEHAPAHAKRTSKSKPLDAPLIDNREHPGARIEYRFGHNMTIDYNIREDSGVLSTHHYADSNRLISNQMFELLQRASISCPDCGYAIEIQESGHNWVTYVAVLLYSM